MPQWSSPPVAERARRKVSVDEVQVHLLGGDADVEEIGAREGHGGKFDGHQGVAGFDRDRDEVFKHTVIFGDGREGVLNGGVARDVDFDRDGVGHIRIPVAVGRFN